MILEKTWRNNSILNIDIGFYNQGGKIMKSIFACLLLICIFSGVGAAASVTTELADYAPFEPVYITGVGFSPNSDITLTVTRPDNSVALNINVKADVDGGFEVLYDEEKTSGTYTIKATDGTNEATNLFTDHNENTKIDTRITVLTHGNFPYLSTISVSAKLEKRTNDWKKLGGQNVEFWFQYDDKKSKSITIQTDENGIATGQLLIKISDKYKENYFDPGIKLYAKYGGNENYKKTSNHNDIEATEPIPPLTPELSPLILTSGGILGLVLISRKGTKK